MTTMEYRQEIPSVCLCGCGETVNALAHEVLKLRKLGLSNKDIAVRLEASYHMVKRCTRVVSKYKVGHSAKASRGVEWVLMECFHRGCTNVVKMPRGTSYPHCRSICVPIDQWMSENAERFDGKEAALHERHRAQTGALRAATQAERELSERARNNPNLQWDEVEYQRRLLAEWREKQSADIQAILDEQQKDLRTFQVQWDPSLDAPLTGSHDDNETTLGDLVGPTPSHMIEWSDPTHDAYLRREANAAMEDEWELEVSNRGHGYDSRSAVPYGWEVMERDRELQETMNRVNVPRGKKIRYKKAARRANRQGSH